MTRENLTRFQNTYAGAMERFGLERGIRGSEARYVDLFPELDSRLSKFAVGIYLWNAKELIDINNPDDISKVRLILRVLDQTPGYDFFDNVFNEADPDTVCQVIGMSPVTPIEEGHIDFDYSVMAVKNFEDAHSYFEAVSWCIVVSEESFKEYTGNGNRFYFCGNGDWWDVRFSQDLRQRCMVYGSRFLHKKRSVSIIETPQC